MDGWQLRGKINITGASPGFALGCIVKTTT